MRRIYTKDGRTVGRFHHQTAVQNVAFSPDGHWLASGGQDGTLKVFDFRRCLSQTMEYDGRSSEEGFAVSGDGQTVALRTKATHSIVLWNTGSQTTRLSCREARTGVGCLPFHRTGDGWSQQPNLRTREGRPSATCGIPRHEHATTSQRNAGIAFAPSIQMVIYCRAEPQDYVGVSVAYTTRWQWTMGSAAPHGIPARLHYKGGGAFSPDGRYLFCGGGSWYGTGLAYSGMPVDRLWSRSTNSMEPTGSMLRRFLRIVGFLPSFIAATS